MKHLRIFIFHPDIFFGEMSASVFCPLVYLFIYFFDFENSLYILETSPLPNTCWANISFQSWLLFFPLIVSFEGHKFLIFNRNPSVDHSSGVILKKSG